ncbi:3-hydroxyacyl-CoA dehydrogenase [Kribbella capetownensis]|uniref:3-hydroxyacyl-CoA dehydrogenase n=1 Tax=Kribbella capetownensis TaxID=1572659 RepID=A0A4R0K679_9ACTN|nr:3-hydroxyacyl-CoA dehydrogenase [Kribbella capetownensis]TCC53486.1 3-hydroxyacyl-CoA dehydrogenase [Kribbella capetownensis]
MTDINAVAVLGTGVLGSQIAYQIAYAGLPVTAYDISDEILESAKTRFEGLAARYEKEVDGAAGGPAQAALKLMRYSSDLRDAVQNTDLVIESVPELLDLKRDVYTKLAKVAPDSTIFASNTSTLLPSDLADATGRPDRFLSLHFANEIWVHNTAEIMGHPGTDPAVYQTIVTFARRIGMVPIELKKEQSGYVINTLSIPWFTAALKLYVDGVADPQMIDNVWRIDKSATEGPFQNLDRVGLKTVYDIYARSGNEQMQAIAKVVKEEYLDKGRLGEASGEGFYKYAETPTASAKK